MLGKPLTVPEIFNNAVFRIPDYQRGYAWTDKELGEFWNDLDLLASLSSQPHYVGVLTLEKVPDHNVASALGNGQDWLKDSGGNIFYVVDGQQRLTTILILLFELIKRHEILCPSTSALTATEDRDSVMAKYIRCENKRVPMVYGYRLGYSCDDQLDAFLRREIFEDKNVAQSARQSAYTQHLVHAKTFFKKELEKTSTTELEERFRLIVERLRFNVFEVDTDLNVCMTFEAINNRGKPVSDLEKLKSRLIYLAGLLAPADPGTLDIYRKQISGRWKMVYTMLGWSPDIKLGDDEFLNLVWIIYYGKYGDRPRAEYLFNQQFFPRTILAEGWEPIDGFSKALKEAVAPWVAMKYPEIIPQLCAQNELTRTISQAASTYLEKLKRLRAEAFDPLVLAALIRHQEGRVSDKQLDELLAASERYVLVVRGLSDRRADTGRNKYFRRAHEVYESPEPEKAVGRCVNEVREDVESYFDAPRFISIVKEWYEKEPRKGFYGWDELKYVLFEYEQDLYDEQFTTSSGKARLLWTSVEGKKLAESVEHIYPETATDSTWTSAFGEVSNLRLLHALGNLLLLSQSKNSSLQNRPYAEKAHGANNYPRPYKNGSCSEHKVANKWQDWTPEAVRERTEELLRFIGKRWALNPDKWKEVTKGVLEYIRPGQTSPSA